MLIVVADQPALARAAAERVTALIEAAIAEHGNAVLSLAGGTTPEELYARLGDDTFPWRARIAWPHVHLFWTDERHVPPDHPDSNFGMAERSLIRHVPIPPAQVHRMRGELPDANAAAADYERRLRDGFAAAQRTGQTFDLILLGLGEDAHIASIFPGSSLLTSDRGDRRAAAVWAPHLEAWRLTLTPRALLDARATLTLVSGEKKAAAVHSVLDLPEDIPRWPGQLLREAGDRVTWIVDAAAASRLSPRP